MSQVYGQSKVDRLFVTAHKILINLIFRPQTLTKPVRDAELSFSNWAVQLVWSQGASTSLPRALRTIFDPALPRKFYMHILRLKNEDDGWRARKGVCTNASGAATLLDGADESE